MTVTNEERRKFAARLRGFGSNYNASEELFDSRIPNAKGYISRGDLKKFCERLADYVEPEPERTCQNLDKQNDGIVFKCSACGHMDFQNFDWEEMLPQNWNYCPNCGARVEE